MKKVSMGKIAALSLKRQSGDNKALIAGVLLAIFFLSTVVFGVSTVIASAGEYQAQRMGRADAALWNIGERDLTEITQTLFDETVIEEVLYSCEGDTQSEANNFFIARYTPELDDMCRYIISEGRMPQKEGEIAIEFGVLMRLRTEYDLGGEIRLNLRCYDGEKMMDETVEKTFVLVGILQTKHWNENSFLSMSQMGGELARGVVSAGEPLLPGSRERRDLVVTYARGTNAEKLETMLQEQGEGDLKWTSLSDDFGLDFDMGSDSAAALMLMVIAVFLALTGVAMAGISAALSSNIDKRRRQIALMRAVGATQKQVRMLLLRETLFIAAAALPAGVLLGIGVLAGARALYPDVIVLSIPAWLVAVDVLACGACVFAASVMPVLRTAGITPMQAVRDIDKTRVFRKKKWKSRRQYKAEGLLAKRMNAMRAGRTRVMVALITAGCLLFSLALMVCGNGIVDAAEREITYEFQIYNSTYYYSRFSNSNHYQSTLKIQDKRDVEALPYVRSVSATQTLVANVLVDEATDYVTYGGLCYSDYEYLSPELKACDMENLEWQRERGLPADAEYTVDELEQRWRENEREDYESYCLLKEEMGWEKEALVSKIVGVSDDCLERIGSAVYDGRIDPEKLASGEEVIVFAAEECVLYPVEMENGSVSMYVTSSVTSQNAGFDVQYVFYNDMFHAGDTIEWSVLFANDDIVYENGERTVQDDVTQQRFTAKIGAVADPAACGLYGVYDSEFGLITTESGMAALGLQGDMQRMNIYCDDFPDDETRQMVAKEIEAITKRSMTSELHDYYQQAQESREFMRTVVIACSAVLLLLFGFTFAILSSSVAAKMQNDLHQIGTMRAVGASGRVVFRCYAGQLLRMFVWGGGIGWALFLIVMRVGWGAYMMGRQGGYIALCAISAPLYTLLLAAACMMTVRVKLRPILRASVVENIRVL